MTTPIQKPRAYGTRSHSDTTPIHTLLFFSYRTHVRVSKLSTDVRCVTYLEFVEQPAARPNGGCRRSGERRHGRGAQANWFFEHLAETGGQRGWGGELRGRRRGWGGVRGWRRGRGQKRWMELPGHDGSGRRWRQAWCRGGSPGRTPPRPQSGSFINPALLGFSTSGSAFQRWPGAWQGAGKRAMEKGGKSQRMGQDQGGQYGARDRKHAGSMRGKGRGGSDRAIGLGPGLRLQYRGQG